MTPCLRLSSPIGELLLTSDGTALTGIYMEPHPAIEGECPPDELLQSAAVQLKEYFLGQRRAFDLPLRLEGTAFQQQVWKALCEIPYGTTISYAELARRIGNPKACRAVGLANGRNPVGIVVPCHRVIGANGTLTGYGGGLDRKEFLLDWEARHISV
ncbi:MAG: methylated-DNA--[protein]-cysteine S-methyltransferase [Gemmataceae bacterium]